jgi:hypothetical protein
MISHKHKCLFVHIPKTAGQSVELVFLESLDLQWSQRSELLLRPNKDPEMGPPRLAHLTVSEYLDYNYLSASDHQEYYSFAFVRNPWERLVSEYRYRKLKYSFQDYVLKYFPTPLDDDYQQAEDYYRHVMPQSDFIFDKKGDCQVDFVGRFENLDRDFATITTQVFGKPLPLPHKNSSAEPTGWRARLSTHKPSSKQHYSQYYDHETQAFVADYYARDIELFNYTFETG